MAGVVFATGFDVYTTITHRFNSSTAAGSGAAISIGAFGRNGSNGLRAVSSAAAGAGFTAEAVKTLPAAIGTIYAGFAFRTSMLPAVSQARTIWAARDVGTIQCDLRLLSDGRLRATRNGTTLAESSVTFLPDVFYHVSIKLVIHPSSGEFHVWINEVVDANINLTGQNTRNSANSTASEVVVGVRCANAENTANNDYDDVVVRDDAQVLDLEVLELLPTGIGATNDWTASGAATTREAVDEAAPNSDTDYMTTANVGDISLFTYPTIPSDSTIVAVIPMPFAKKTDAGTAQIKSVIRLSSTNYAGAAKAPSNGSYEYHPEILMVSPDTGVAFTPAEWNAPIEVGVERSA